MSLQQVCGSLLAGALMLAVPAPPSPPPERIEAEVVTTDPSGLFKINAGTKAGLHRGDILEVYRSRDDKHLGRIRIIDLRADEAVGQPIGKMLGPIRVGEWVVRKLDPTKP